MIFEKIRERLELTSKIFNESHLDSTSQAGQDIFAFVIGEITGNKTYLEVGAKFPYYISNTRYLEKYGWAGNSIEIDKAWKPYWENSDRDISRLIWEDALTYDYTTLPKKIGFLSCDIDPPLDINIKALSRIINAGTMFDSICYETNAYLKKGDVIKNVVCELSIEERKKEVEDVLYPLGYKKVISDVGIYGDPNKPFEDWFVHESVDFPCMSHEEFLVKYQNIFWNFYD